MKYVIDGLFLVQKLTGIQRYAKEICEELDKLIKKDEVEILIPSYSETVPAYQNIRIVKYGERKGRMWEQIDLMNYLKKTKSQGVFLTNELPLLYPKGIACIHDISYKVNPSFFKDGNKRLSRLWHCINYSAIVRHCKKMLTVSEFSKSEICRVYDVDGDRIRIASPSWQHMNDIHEDCSIIDNNKALKNKDFYFSMSTLALNKNFRWVLSAAKQNPGKEFAIAGGGKLADLARSIGYEDLPNIHFLGYVSDEEAKALMHNCKAFLFPTLYEGFGLPPLEAIASGCKSIIVSDTPCMHEVYGDYAVYINPNKYDGIHMDELEADKNVADLLKKYSWAKSATVLYQLIKEDQIL